MQDNNIFSPNLQFWPADRGWFRGILGEKWKVTDFRVKDDRSKLCLGRGGNTLYLVVCEVWQRRSGRADERECLTMEESRQLLWQAKRGELILVPLQHAHLLPATHKASSHPTHITPSQSVTATNTAGTNKAWLEGLEATRQGVTSHKRLCKMLNT